MPKLSDFTREQLESLDTAILDDEGREILNPVPKDVPVALAREESMSEKLIRIARGTMETELARKAALESPEQLQKAIENEQDFDVKSTFEREPLETPYEKAAAYQPTFGVPSDAGYVDDASPQSQAAEKIKAEKDKPRNDEGKSGNVSDVPGNGAPQNNPKQKQTELPLKTE